MIGLAGDRLLGASLVGGRRTNPVRRPGRDGGATRSGGTEPSATCRSAFGRGVSLLVVLALLNGCVHFDTSLSGQLIDAESRRPITGAAVALERRASCLQIAHSYTTSLSPRETRSGPDGRFSIGGGPSLASCPFAFAWVESVRILAPGYFEEQFRGPEGPGSDLALPPYGALTTAPLALRPWRYRADALAYERRPESDSDATMQGAGPIRRETIEAIRSIAVRALGPSGVFVADPDAAFDRIALTRLSWQRPRSTGVLVRDAKSGRIRAFSAQGASLEVPIPAVPSATPAVATGLGYPALLERDRIHYARHLDFRLPLLGVAATDWHSIAVERPPVLTAAQTDSVLMTVEDGGERLGVYRVGTEPTQGRLRAWIGSLSDHAVSELLPGARPPVECVAAEPGRDVFFVVAQVEGRRGLFRVAWAPPVYTESRVTRLAVPLIVLDYKVKITACAAGRQTLFIALDNGSVHRLSTPAGRGSSRPVWAASKFPPGAGPQHFVGMATGELERDLEVVYAVSGTGTVYRFTGDGVPDQRVEFATREGAR